MDGFHPRTLCPAGQEGARAAGDHQPARELDLWRTGFAEYSARELPARPGDLAYLAFTSGTTGKAKAIACTHRPLPHFFNWHVSTFGFTQEDRFAALSGVGHDPLLRDLFTPWWVGAAVCIPAEEPARASD